MHFPHHDIMNSICNGIKEKSCLMESEYTNFLSSYNHITYATYQLICDFMSFCYDDTNDVIKDMDNSLARVA